MKKLLVLVFAVSLVLALSACSSNSSSNGETTATPATTPEVANTPVAETEQKDEASETTEAVVLNPDGAYNVILVDSGTESLKVLTAVRDALGLDLMTAKELVNSAPTVIEQQLTLAEAEALKAAIEAEGATIELQETEKLETQEAATANGSVNVILTDAGTAKLNVVKEIKNQLDLGLAESKDFVDNIPSTIAKGITQEEAEALKAALEAVGATVEIQ